jgi:hypothetical protein
LAQVDKSAAELAKRAAKAFALLLGGAYGIELDNRGEADSEGNRVEPL